MADVEEITLAIRLVNAARNLLAAAEKRLSKTLPDKAVVLHCKPGEAGKPDTLYWTYWPHQECGYTFGVSKEDEHDGWRFVIVEAPAPREEVIPLDELAAKLP